MAEHYEHKLVYVGSVDRYIADGWEPTPGTAQVNKLVVRIVQTYVWMRRAI